MPAALSTRVRLFTFSGSGSSPLLAPTQLLPHLLSALASVYRRVGFGLRLTSVCDSFLRRLQSLLMLLQASVEIQHGTLAAEIGERVDERIDPVVQPARRE
jgi:hypothetical protein